MKLSRQAGAMNLLVIPLILLLVVLVGVAIFAYTSYVQAQDYKLNLDQKVEVAVEEASLKIAEQKDKDFAEKEKFPYNTYSGPEAAGSLKLQYPKTWSGYVVAPQGRTSKPLDAWFHPGQVPSTDDDNNSFALRVTVAQQSYESIIKSFQGEQKSGKVTIQPYQSPNVPGVVGSRLDGEIRSKKQGSMVVMPFRDKTLQMWTESTEFKPDFDSIIVRNFVLTP